MPKGKTIALFTELKTLLRTAKESRRKRFYLLSIVMIASSLTEAINLGLVLPFVGLLVSQKQIPESVLGHNFLQTMASFTDLNPILAMAMVFCFVTLVAGALRALQLHLSVRLAYDFGADLSAQIYRYVLNQPYITHFSRNSSEVVSGILGHVNQVISWVLQPLLTLISSSIIFFAIVIGLFLIGKIFALLSVLAFVLLYLVIVFAFRKRMRKNSEIIDRTQTELVRNLQEGIGSLRDIILTRTQNRFANIFDVADRQLRKASSDSLFWGSIPRIFVEALGICIIVAIAYTLSHRIDDTTLIIQILATITLGAQRVLPALQQIYSSWTSIAGSESTLRTINRLLGEPINNDQLESKAANITKEFNESIELKNLSFAYNSQLPILKELNIRIAQGQTIGIFGASGSGKSTLLDIVMGLLPPSAGTIEVDGAKLLLNDLGEWQSLIAHVPQTIFLLDASISENIAFGISKNCIDETRVLKCAQIAKVLDFTQPLRGGLEAVCGERGIRLSGGQRQRIGIARALYRQPSILVLDEATNSLEPELEQVILRNIKEEINNLTIVMVAHRQTNFTFCDEVYELAECRLTPVQGNI